MRFPVWPGRAPGPCASASWAFVGAVGGAGATTLAIEAAHALAGRTRKDRSICLIDLNPADGAMAAYLGVAPQLKAEAPAIGDAVAVTGKIDLLAWPRDPEGFTRLGAEAALGLLDAAQAAYDLVLIDLPRHRHPWTLPALAACDEVLVISELTTPALRAARDLAQDLEIAVSGLHPRIVLNRMAARSSGAAPTMGQAEQVMQRKATAGISSDWEAAAAAANLGGAIARHQPKSRIVRDVAALVDRLTAEAEAAARRAA